MTCMPMVLIYTVYSILACMGRFVINYEHASSNLQRNNVHVCHFWEGAQASTFIGALCIVVHVHVYNKCVHAVFIH